MKRKEQSKKRPKCQTWLIFCKGYVELKYIKINIRKMHMRFDGTTQRHEWWEKKEEKAITQMDHTSHQFSLNG